MKKTYALISLLVLYCTSIIAQTPFDSFAPETSRPMLGMDAITARENPSQGNGSTDSVINIELSADDISKWLSVDPLADKYPNISPYAYCGWTPVNRIDPDGRDTINLVQNNNVWDIKSKSIVPGNDVFNLQHQDGKLSTYEFSKGKYLERVNCLNLENTGDGGYTLGVYHISGARKGGTGFYVTPGGESSNSEKSGKRINDGNYPLLAPWNGAEWQFPGVGGDAVTRGARFHYGGPNPVTWTEACFILFPSYSLSKNGNIGIDLNISLETAIDFAHLLGGVGCVNYVTAHGKSRTGVKDYPYGIQEKLFLISR